MIKVSIAIAFFFGAIASNMSAAPKVTFVNIPGSGMELIPGSSTQFKQLFTDFAGADAVSVLQPILPYSVIVKNGSSSLIQSLTVCFHLKDYQGRVISDVQQFDLVGVLAGPGEMVLMAPINGLTMYMAPGATPRLQNKENLALKMANVANRYGDKSEIAVALDSVIFKDNSMIGPDLAGKFDELNRERSIAREMVAEILKRTRSERPAYLARISNDPEAQQALAQEELGQRKRLADMFQNILTVNADEDSFRNSMEYYIQNQAQELHRRNP